MFALHGGVLLEAFDAGRPTVDELITNARLVVGLSAPSDCPFVRRPRSVARLAISSWPRRDPGPVARVSRDNGGMDARGGDGPLPVLLVGLTVVTGLVDAFSFLVLAHVFVANMTGNVVFLGFGLAGVGDIAVVASLCGRGVRVRRGPRRPPGRRPHAAGVRRGRGGSTGRRRRRGRPDRRCPRQGRRAELGGSACVRDGWAKRGRAQARGARSDDHGAYVDGDRAGRGRDVVVGARSTAGAGRGDARRGLCGRGVAAVGGAAALLWVAAGVLAACAVAALVASRRPDARGVAYSDRSERGSPKCGSTLVSKRVMAQILVSLRVSTMRPLPWLTPSGPRR